MKHIRSWFAFALFASLILAPQAQSASLRLKNFREIYAAYQSVLNVSASDADVSAVYALVRDRLPKTGQAQEFSSSVVLATTELGGAFCKKAITLEKAMPFGERNLFYNIDFDYGPFQLSGYETEVLAKNLANAFWQRDLTQDERKVIYKLVDTASNEDLTSPEATEVVLRSICTTFATSLAFLTK
jgi:hypothetical protein